MAAITVEELRQHLLVGHWYESREAVAIGVQAQVLPDGAMDLVGPFRRFVF
jgi:hypothetical protein